MCKWYEINIEPRDVLFFRRAKPISGSAIGEGAQWPMPSVFHQSLLSAFHERWPEREALGEHEHKAGATDKNPNSSFRFGGLKTVGVFPSRDGTLYFPTPADLQCLDDSETPCVLAPGELKGCGDLPEPLKCGLFKDGSATKKNPGDWISFGHLEQYLRGDLQGIKTIKSSDLYAVEPRPGIGIDPQTGTADTGGEDEGGKFYIAEYMRLHEGKNKKGRVSLKGLATCEQVRIKERTPAQDVFDRFFDGRKDTAFVFGGQRGAAHLEGTRDSATADRLFAPATPESHLIKWVLLTPSIFTGGWLPSWVAGKSGKVAQYEIPPRGERETRKEWRDRVKKENGAKEVVLGQLVAACIPKPIPYSGWRVHGGKDNKTGARPTRLCVPAGAVYYFEVSENESPEKLVRFLNGQCKSDMAAEKGFGFGICGTWKPFVD